jgi:succinate-acetate transporter protein
MVLGLALFYGGLAQFCAGMWEFRTGNTFGATVFSSYGAFWISLAFSLLPLFGGKSLAGLAGATAVGVYLLGWTIFTGYMFLGSLRTTGALAAIFVLLFLAFLFLTIGSWGNQPA